ncbi:MAG: hypothetical protein ABWY05_08410 [Noviherbaspirillum sp.]
MLLKEHINRYYLDDMNLMTHAARVGDLAMIRVLAALGANIHLPSPNRATPLLAAAAAGQWAACAELLGLGADPLTRNVGGYPALYYIASAFADTHTVSPALARLIRYLRLRGWFSISRCPIQMKGIVSSIRPCSSPTSWSATPSAG